MQGTGLQQLAQKKNDNPNTAISKKIRQVSAAWGKHRARAQHTL